MDILVIPVLVALIAGMLLNRPRHAEPIVIHVERDEQAGGLGCLPLVVAFGVAILLLSIIEVHP